MSAQLATASPRRIKASHRRRRRIASGQSVQRYYDPAIGKMLSVDPVTAYSSGNMQHFNVYAYAYNSPYTLTDSDGRAPNKAGATNPSHVWQSLKTGGLANLRDTHGGNSSRYFYTKNFGWVDIRHFAEAARRVTEGQSPNTVRTLGVLNEVDQYATEWGDDYRSGFSPEDLPSNEAGISFGEFLQNSDSDTLAGAFLRWGRENGALPADDSRTGYENLPATDPSTKGGTGRGSNADSAPPPPPPPKKPDN